MKIATNTVASIDYTVRNEKGEVLDTSEGNGPLVYLHGHGQIVPGLERALDGSDVGDSLEVRVAANDAYGDRHEDRVVNLPREQLPANLDLEPGTMIAVETPDGRQVPMWVTQIDESKLTLDGNHPLAGQDLTFDVTIREVRDATDEERTHGHAHGPGGHPH